MTHNTNNSRVVKRSDGRVGVIFEPEDIKRIATPCQWLNSSCINGCAGLFQAMFSNQKDHALFSTHNLAHIRNDALLWRNTRGTRFWKWLIWILPIHWESQAHWVLAIVQVRDRCITLFDSFGPGPKTWSTDMKVPSDSHISICLHSSPIPKAITTFISRLAAVAKKNGEQMDILDHNWSARQLTVHFHHIFSCSVLIKSSCNSFRQMNTTVDYGF